MIKVNGERLLADLRTLAQFGAEGTGVNRLSLTQPDIDSRTWLLGRMKEAGLEARIDGIGSVYGQTPDVSRAILIGSHTDTVPNGGWLDGAMGVIYGLELARALLESGDTAPGGIDVISFADEEATYANTLGSRAFVGEVTQEELAAAANLGGERLLDALDRAGYAGAARAGLDRTRHQAYFEAHIEQGPRLEAAGKRIGIVTGIVGMRSSEIVFHGQADHAGTTPMAMRKDAGAALFRFASRLITTFEGIAGPDTVWNFGHVAFDPGAGNVVPREARVLIEYRNPTEDILDTMESAIGDAVAQVNANGVVKATAVRKYALAAVQMDRNLAQSIEDAAARLDAPAMRMPSGAGHDAMHLARHVPAGMVFIPSIGGRSHDTAEDSAEADIVLGAQVLADAVQSVLSAN